MKTHLTEKEENAVRQIVESSNRSDGTSYTAPLDADGYYLSFHDGSPVSVLAVYYMGDTRDGREVEEILLFTAPEYRNKKRASKLWRKYTADREDRNFSVRFSAYVSEAAAAYLAHRNALHDHDEVMMVRHLGGSSGNQQPLKELDFPVFRDYSECSVKTYGTVGYIYGVRTDTGHLREGSAERLLEEVFSRLYAMGASDAVLEVSSSNIPAWKLYRKTGFEVAEQLQIWYIDHLR